jgi:hypothetical protein
VVTITGLTRRPSLRRRGGRSGCEASDGPGFRSAADQAAAWGGFEDFEDVVDRPLTVGQAAALLDFVACGRQEGFLQVEVNAPDPEDVDHEDPEAWWSGRS